MDTKSYDYRQGISKKAEERNRLMGPAAFMADPKGYYRWVRTVGLPSLNPPEMSEANWTRSDKGAYPTNKKQ